MVQLSCKTMYNYGVDDSTYDIAYGTTITFVSDFSDYEYAASVNSITVNNASGTSVTFYKCAVSTGQVIDSCTVKFYPTYTVSFTRSGGTGIVKLRDTSFGGTSGSITVRAGFSVDVTANGSAYGNKISSFKVNGSTISGASNQTSYTYTISSISSDYTFTIVFEEQITYYTISYSSGSHGTINGNYGSGSTQVQSGSSKTLNISADSNYYVDTYTVDGNTYTNKYGYSSFSYTFSNVTTTHTFSVSFYYVPPSYNITASAGTGGTISPSGSVSVSNGGSKTFTVTPNTGYRIKRLLVDNVSQSGWINVTGSKSYTFSNVTTTHTIAAEFTNEVTLVLKPNGGTIQYRVGQNGTDVQITTDTTVTVHTGDYIRVQQLLLPEGKYFVRFERELSYNTVHTQSDYDTSTSYAFTIPTSFTEGTGMTAVSYTPDRCEINAVYEYQPIQVVATRPTDTDITYKIKVGSNSAVTVSNNSQTITTTAIAGDRITISDIQSTRYNVTAVKWYVTGSSFDDGAEHTIAGNTGYFSIPAVDSGITVFKVTIVLECEVKTYEITASAGTGGTINPSGKVSVEHGSSQTFQITANTGYRIKDIKVDDTSIDLNS